MTQPRQVHIVATKHVMRYLKGIIEYGLWFSADCEFKLQGFIDSDSIGNVKDRKSTSGCSFNLGSTVISWFNRKQTSIALSTAEQDTSSLVQRVLKQFGSRSCCQVYLM